MAEVATIEMQDRGRCSPQWRCRHSSPVVGWAADMIAKQAVAYADALIEALAADESLDS